MFVTTSTFGTLVLQAHCLSKVVEGCNMFEALVRLDDFTLAEPGSFKDKVPKDVLPMLLRGDLEILAKEAVQYTEFPDLEEGIIGPMPHLTAVTSVAAVVQQVMQQDLRIDGMQHMDGALLTKHQITLLLSVHANMRTLCALTSLLHQDIILKGHLRLTEAGDRVNTDQLNLLLLTRSTCSQVRDTLHSESLKPVEVSETGEPTKLLKSLYFFQQWIAGIHEFINICVATYMSFFKEIAQHVGTPAS
jgi:hypothetical protein